MAHAAQTHDDMHTVHSNIGSTCTAAAATHRYSTHMLRGYAHMTTVLRGAMKETPKDASILCWGKNRSSRRRAGHECCCSQESAWTWALGRTLRIRIQTPRAGSRALARLYPSVCGWRVGVLACTRKHLAGATPHRTVASRRLVPWAAWKLHLCECFQVHLLEPWQREHAGAVHLCPRANAVGRMGARPL